MNTEQRIITVHEVECTVEFWYEHVVAWAIHTSKDRKNITIERITPITVESGLNISRHNAQPESVNDEKHFECTQFPTQYGYDEGAGSVRFIQAEPGVRLVIACIEGSAPINTLIFDLGLEYPHHPLVITDEFLAGRAKNEIKKAREQEQAQSPTPYRASGTSPGAK